MAIREEAFSTATRALNHILDGQDITVTKDQFLIAFVIGSMMDDEEKLKLIGDLGVELFHTREWKGVSGKICELLSYKKIPEEERMKTRDVGVLVRKVDEYNNDEEVSKKCRTFYDFYKERDMNILLFKEYAMNVRQKLKDALKADRIYLETKLRIEEDSKLTKKERKEKGFYNLFDISCGKKGRDIYRESFVGRNYVSIDIKKSNATVYFYLLPHLLGFPEIVETYPKDKHMWEHFASTHSDDEIFNTSKITRQITFGQLNTNIYSTGSHHLINFIYNICSFGSIKDKIRIIALDEIIIEVEDSKEGYELVERIRECIAKNETYPWLSSCYHLDYFELELYQGTNSKGELESPFYIRNVLDSEDKLIKKEIKCLSLKEPMLLSEHLKKTKY